MNANNKIYTSTYAHTLSSLRACDLCQAALPFPAKPIVQLHPSAQILIIGQAPGLTAHNTEMPWNDPSGERLRKWLNVSRQTFYDNRRFAIMPMGFCYPGKRGNGDAPPRAECAPAWHKKITQFIQPEITLLVGVYAQRYYLPQYKTLAEAMKSDSGANNMFVLPHPSGRNNRWLKQHQLTVAKQIDTIQQRLNTILR